MNFKTHINFDTSKIYTMVDYTQYCCDSCSNKLTSNHYFFGNYEVQLCENCSEKFSEMFTYVDRTNMTEEEKPRLWNCNKCDLALGGGLDWYYIKDIDLDLCKDCYLNKKLIKYSPKITLIKRCGVVIVDLNLPDIDFFSVPNAIKTEITDDRNNMFVNIISEIAYCDIETPLLYWTIFTELFEKSDFSSAFIVNCNKDSSNEVAIIIFDDHSRVGIYTIFKTFSDYLKSITEWKNDNLGKDFSEYIVLERKLNTYYG